MNLLKSGTKLLKKVVKYDPILKNLPETQMVIKAGEAKSMNPYGQEASTWDYLGAGPLGQITKNGKALGLDPENPEDRAIGRTIGSIAAAWYGAGALGANASGAATAASAAGQGALQMEGRNAAERMAAEEEALQRELIAQLRGEQTPDKQPTPIPLADEEAMRRQRRRNLASIQRRRGRQSTILTGGGQGALGA